jgi:predicted metalloprotease
VLLRWIPIVCAVLLASGCGSSSEDGAARQTATPAPTVGSSDLERMPPAPEPSRLAAASGNAFLRSVFDDAEALWEREFEAAGLDYRPARLTIFSDVVHTACGTQESYIGPFYCPASAGVYLDTTFFAALSARVGVALGDFAQAYVVAHEVAHHVQSLLGILGQVAAANEQHPEGENARSVRVELQADCFAGVWAHSAYRRGDLTREDFADALRAAFVVGSDFQQRAATGTIAPDDWTHGSSAQRQHWLTTGFEQGRPAACDTFSIRQP